MSTVFYGLGLALVWVLLWGSVSWANVLSGLLVAAVLILLFVPQERRVANRPVIRPLALLRLGAYLLRQLFVSNVMLIREVVTPLPKLKTGVLAVPVGGCSEQLITVLANFMAMAPGTMPVEVERLGPSVLYVHILTLSSLDEVRRDLFRLRDLTVAALGSGPALDCIGTTA